MFQSGEQIARAQRATHCINVGDSESDIHELYRLAMSVGQMQNIIGGRSGCLKKSRALDSVAFQDCANFETLLKTNWDLATNSGEEP